MFVFVFVESLLRFKYNAPTWLPLSALPPALATCQPEKLGQTTNSAYMITTSFLNSKG